MPAILTTSDEPATASPLPRWARTSGTWARSVAAGTSDARTAGRRRGRTQRAARRPPRRRGRRRSSASRSRAPTRPPSPRARPRAAAEREPEGEHGRRAEQRKQRVRPRLLRVPDEERVRRHERGGDDAGARSTRARRPAPYATGIVAVPASAESDRKPDLAEPEDRAPHPRDDVVDDRASPPSGGSRAGRPRGRGRGGRP